MINAVVDDTPLVDVGLSITSRSISRPVPLVNEVNVAPPYEAANENVLVATADTQYFTPAVRPLAVILGITASPTSMPCNAEVNVLLVAIVVTLICGVDPVVESPEMIFVIISIPAPTNELARLPVVRFTESVHCVAVLPVVLVTVVFATICCITVFNLP